MNLREGDVVSAIARVASTQSAEVNGDADDLTIEAIEEIANENASENGGGETDG